MIGNKYSVALIGAGGMGKRWAQVIAARDDALLTYVVDTDLSRASSLAAATKAVPVSDLTTVLQDAKVDIGIVALPHHVLAKISEQLLRAGKHVISEKPGARASEELEAVGAIAEERQLRYMVGFNHRFHSAHARVKHMVEDGVIGDPIFLRAIYGFGGRKGYEKEWRHNKNVSGGGELIDQGVHLIDLARWYFGDVVEAKGYALDLFWHSGVDDNAFLLLKHTGGRPSLLHASWSQWKPTHRVELYGTKGYLRIEGLGKKYSGPERIYWGNRQGAYAIDDEILIECDVDADGSLNREFEEFISAIKENRAPHPSWRDGSAALRIVESIYENT